MPTFWQALPQIKAEYGENFHAFELYGPEHLCELAICLVLGTAVALLYRRADEQRRHRILWVVTLLLLIDEAIKHIATGVTGQWDWQYLPLHLCSINIFVCLYHTLRGGETVKEFLYALCLPGALLALFSPSWQAAPAWNVIHLHSLSVHFLLALYPVLLLAGGFRPNVRRLPKVLGHLLAMAVPIFFINRLLGTNFLFLNRASENAITRAFAAIFGEKLYYLGFLPVILVLAAVLYLPWILAARLSKKSHSTADRR